MDTMISSDISNLSTNHIPMPAIAQVFEWPLVISEVVDENDNLVTVAESLLLYNGTEILPMDQWQCLKPEYMKNVFERARNNERLLDRDTACSDEKYRQVLKRYAADIESSQTIVVQKPWRPKGSKNK